MPITLADALESREFHGPSYANPSKIITVRRNGKTQTWKTRPGEFRIPIKYGLYGYGEITHNDAARWTAGPAPRTR